MSNGIGAHGQNVLVTGGAGYIGSHACKGLAAAGYTPVTYDNLVNGHASAVRWGPLEHGDILDRQRLDEVILKYRPWAIMHFAAFAYVDESMSDPGKYYRNNVAGSLVLIQAAHHHGIRNFVYSSSCAIYGIPDSVPIAEDMPKHPISPYGMSKLMVERILQDFERLQVLSWTALRYFNAAGCDPSGEIGEAHSPEPHIIPLAIRAAADMGHRFTIFGADYATPDGTCIRDYVHVSDLAQAHIKALKAVAAGTLSGGLNVGTGRGYSVREVIESVRRVTGRDLAVEVGPRRAGDPPRLVSDGNRARRIIGWEPQISALDDIVRTTWNWWSRAHGLHSSKSSRGDG